MSDETVKEAGKMILEAAEDIASATDAIGRVVVSRCPGCEDLTPQATETLRKTLSRLIRLRDEIEGVARYFRD